MTDAARAAASATPFGKLWKSLVETTSRGVDHGEVLAHVYDEGETSTRYVIMTALAAALAMLGLLMPSQAVLIGAMLLSPLMGPIILLGFSFWMVEWRSTKRALVGIAAGFLIALVLSILITWISPLKEPTTEILARARPTLFDLLVAIFSGLAGGYAVIKRKGETAIGVALAISLMPPITTVGFGIGIGAWNIAMSAMLLFVTNLVATVLAAAMIAAIYGFKPHYHFRDRGWLSHAAVIGVLLGLCVPLTLSLQSIALEGRATHDTRDAIGRIFGEKARIASLAVRADHGRLKVDALVATPSVTPKADEQLETYLHRLTPQVAVSLDQLVTGDPARFLRTAPPATPAVANPAEAATRGLRDLVPFPTRLVMADGVGGGVVALPAQSGLDLAGAHALEQGLRQRETYRNVIVTPPVQDLPPVEVRFGEDGAAVMGEGFPLVRWAVERWQPVSLSVSGCRLRGAQGGAVEKALVEAMPSVRIDFTASSRACAGGGQAAGIALRLG
jgi:uncharacterized hydrophobic protein (TIGR00271 family)